MQCKRGEELNIYYIVLDDINSIQLTNVSSIGIADTKSDEPLNMDASQWMSALLPCLQQGNDNQCMCSFA